MSLALFSPAGLALAVAVFVAVLLLLEGLYLLWQQRFGREARRLHHRLQDLTVRGPHAEPGLLRQRRSGAGLWPSLQARVPALQALAQRCQQAGLDWPLPTLLLSSLALGALALLLAGAAAQPWPVVAAASAAGLAPWVYVSWRRRRRLGQLQQQLPEALDLMVRALRAGHAFPSSLQMVGDEMSEPLASEFKMVHDEVNYGLSLPQALGHLVERVPLPDLRYFVVAVLIQREAGGNLTELLSKLSGLIRARLKLLLRVQVLSSEGRLSGRILLLMPFALGALLSYFNSAFMQPLWTDPMGQSLLTWTLGLMGVGVILMRAIVRIRV